MLTRAERADAAALNVIEAVVAAREKCLDEEIWNVRDVKIVLLLTDRPKCLHVKSVAIDDGGVWWRDERWKKVPEFQELVDRRVRELLENRSCLWRFLLASNKEEQQERQSSFVFTMCEGRLMKIMALDPRPYGRNGEDLGPYDCYEREETSFFVVTETVERVFEVRDEDEALRYNAECGSWKGNRAIGDIRKWQPGQ